MNSFSFPRAKKRFPKKDGFYSFLEAGQDPGGEKKMGPGSGPVGGRIGLNRQGKNWDPLLTLNGLSRWPPGVLEGSGNHVNSKKTMV